MTNATFAIMERELRKWYRSPFLVFMTIIQPLMWLGLFGKAFNLRGFLSIPDEVLNQLPPNSAASLTKALNDFASNIFGGTLDYFSFMAAGMLCIVVLFTAVFSGMSVLWDRRLGFLDRLLAAPIPRRSILLGKIFSSVVRAVIQATLVFTLALAFGLNLAGGFGWMELLMIYGALALLALGLASLFLSITIRIRSWEAHMGIMNLLTLPMMFASNALFPIRQMPSWLQTVASLNPLSYATDAVRQSLLNGWSTMDMSRLIMDFTLLSVFAGAFTLTAALMAERALKEG